MALPHHLAGLLEADAYAHPCSRIDVVETHISWVILTGDFAYKLKKPVHFSFVDFSTLARREHFCREELRCNRAFAPSLYLDVVPVMRDRGGRLHLGGQGEVIEWAVCMRQFPAHAQLDRLVESGTVEPRLLTEFGHSLAERHRALPALPLDATALEPRVLAPLRANFDDLQALDWVDAQRALLAEARNASEAQVAAHRRLLAERLEQGWTRECHGDLHLSNLVLLDGEVAAFDCLEFDPDLRCIDPQSDVAFLFMDCLVRGRADLAYAFVDGYLDRAGDYQGARLLPLYAAYRSMVRAKVAALQRESAAGDQAAASERRFALHLGWTVDWLKRPPGRLLLMCGLSGSGKSFLAERLAPLFPAVRLRSDVARKASVPGAAADPARPSGNVDAGLYEPARRQGVYDRLLDVAADLLASGEHVIVDATFLTDATRRPFLDRAAALGSPVTVVYCEAPLDVLRERILARRAAGDDPSDADLSVLERQRSALQPPSGPVLRVDTGRELDDAALQALRTRLLTGV